jgi:KAP family P-loop domain
MIEQFSSSVQSAANALGMESNVTSWAFVKQLCRAHPEYGAGMAEKLLSVEGPEGVQTRKVSAWLAAVREAIVPQVAIVSGRPFILALARIDTALDAFLARVGLIASLKQELKQPYEELWVDQPTEFTPPPSSRIPDPSPLHADDPADQDELGREAFSRVLAKRLKLIRKQNSVADTSFIMHLHGPWGAGKTTVLKLLGRHLRTSESADSNGANDSRWVVVGFNAWLNQRLTPPWWPLLDAVYRQSLYQISAQNGRRLRRQERRWRWITSNREQVVVGCFALIITFLLAISFFLIWPSLQGALKEKSETGDTLTRPKETVEVGHLSVAFLTGMAGIVLAIAKFTGRPFVSGSARAAQSFMQNSEDPMKLIAWHFRKIIESIGSPVVVFIDDLDRCHGEYIVMLLEGIQTLFNNRNVTYVLTADRRWLYTSFEKAYEQYTDSIKEPGRRLGYLFLEKAVQLSVSLPRLSRDAQKGYWDYLIYGDSASLLEVRRQAQRDAEQSLSNANSHQEIANKLQSVSVESADDAIRIEALREAAVLRLATETADRGEEVFLRSFAPFLERNPRGMKRLLNAYSLHRDMAILAGLDVLGDLNLRKQLVLWTIVCMRWPMLEEAVTENLSYFDVIQLETDLKQASQELRDLVDRSPKDLRELLIHESVKEVFRGRDLEGYDLGAKLTKRAIEDFVSLRTTSTGSATVV